jgi:hypothetical protein
VTVGVIHGQQNSNAMSEDDGSGDAVRTHHSTSAQDLTHDWRTTGQAGATTNTWAAATTKVSQHC